MGTLIIIATAICAVIIFIVAICMFVRFAKELFGDDTDPHTYVDARKLPRSSKKSKS